MARLAPEIVRGVQAIAARLGELKAQNGSEYGSSPADTGRIDGLNEALSLLIQAAVVSPGNETS